MPGAVANTIPIIPRTSHLKNVMSSIDDAQLFSEFNPTIIVVLHHYDFDQISGSESALVKLEKLFQFINNNENINPTSLNKISQQYDPTLSTYNIKTYGDNKKTHWRIKRYLPQDFIFIHGRRQSNEIIITENKKGLLFS